MIMITCYIEHDRETGTNKIKEGPDKKRKIKYFNQSLQLKKKLVQSMNTDKQKELRKIKKYLIKELEDLGQTFDLKAWIMNNLN